MQRPDPSSVHYKDFCRFQEKLRKKILTLREKHGFTQEDMTEYGLSLRQYQRMEQDATSIVSLWQVHKIAKAYGLSLHDLLDIS